MNTLSDFLGFSSSHAAYVIGAGSLGAALMQDNGLQKYGLDIVAAFDTKSGLIGTNVCGIPIYDIEEIYDMMESNPAQIGIITVPADSAQQAADTAISAGIRAIWNFTPYRVKVAEGIVMANTSIYAHLALIYNRLKS